MFLNFVHFSDFSASRCYTKDSYKKRGVYQGRIQPTNLTVSPEVGPHPNTIILIGKNLTVSQAMLATPWSAPGVLKMTHLFTVYTVQLPSYKCSRYNYFVPGQRFCLVTAGKRSNEAKIKYCSKFFSPSNAEPRQI